MKHLAVLTGVIVATLVAACSPHESQKPQESIPSLLKRWDDLNEQCRGSSDQKVIDKACPAREAVGKQLEGLGMCYGEGAPDGASSTWAPCGHPPVYSPGSDDSSPTNTSPSSEPPSAAQASSEAASPSPPSDHIDYDQGREQRKDIFEGYRASGRQCAVGVVDGQLASGERSRSHLTDTVVRTCSGYVQAMISYRLENQQTAESELRAWANDEIDLKVQENR